MSSALGPHGASAASDGLNAPAADRVSASAPFPEIIERRFRDELDAFSGTRGKSEIYASLRAVTEYTANEYGNRFLVELIQNGHDAHMADGAPGEMCCCFIANEAEFGTLYVANQGRPFLERDFSSICQFARSSKRPGESIGNKGIGFRSVLQVCEFPEVYSADSPQVGADAFRGFCFSFARAEDLDRLVPDSDLRDAVRRDVPPHVLPVALSYQNEYVRSLAAAGFSTVVRLPLKSADARKDVFEALDTLFGGTAPILLFLERISRIRVETKGLPEGGWYCDVSRRRDPSELPRVDDTQIDVVEIRNHGDSAEDEVGRYLLVSALVPESEMLEVIDASIGADKLPTSWRQWTGAGRVALATRLTGDAGPGILYNYLPMGEESASPFLGHLDAPFYAKIDRTSLHPSVPLNDFLLDEAARLAARAARVLAQAPGQALRDAVVDLLAWTPPVHTRLSTAFRELGWSLETAPVLPILEATTREASGALKEMFRWTRTDLPALSAHRLESCARVHLLPPRIAGARVQRLEQLKTTLTGQGLDPSKAQVASWVPSIASHLHATNAPAREWDEFYSDLAQVFWFEARLLEGRRIILDAQNRLLPAGTAQTTEPSARSRDSESPTVFFSPARVRTYGEEEVDERDDLTIPPDLRAFITYTHPSLSWASVSGRVDARDLFARHKLVRKFERRELREYLRDLLAVHRSDDVRAAALDLAYRLSRSASESLEPRLDRMNLYVPTEDGAWIPAAQACFSPEWATPAADALARYIEHASSISPQVAVLRERRIVSPALWPTQVDDIASWAAFLLRAGVSDGLSIEERGSLVALFRPTELSWRPEAIGVSVTGTGAPEWFELVRSANATYPSHQYQLSRPAPLLPGQEQYTEMTDSARTALAELIAHGLARWPDSVFSVEVKKAQKTPDKFLIPSPLVTFLRIAAWVRTSSSDSGARYLAASDAWLPSATTDRVPPFVPQPSRPLRALLANHPASTRMSGLLGAGGWADPAFASREIRALAAWLDTRPLTTAQLHTLEENYRRAWRAVLRHDWQAALGSGQRPWPLVVRLAGRLTTVGSSADGEESRIPAAVYLADEEWGLRSYLIESLGRPLFDPGVTASDSEVAEAAARFLSGLDIRRVSSLDPVILVGEVEYAINASRPRLVSGRLEWLVELVALLIEVEGSSGIRSRVQRERAIEQLKRIRVDTAVDISVRVDSDVLPLPENAGGALAIQHQRTPTILIPPRLSALERNDLPVLARPIADLLGHASLAGPLELALSRLGRLGGSAELSEPPSTEEFIQVVGVSPSRLEAIRASLRTSVSALLTKVRPILSYALGRDAALRFGDDEETLASASDVAGLLEEYATVLPRSVSEIVSVCGDSQDLEEVRDCLGLDYARFNAALRALAPAYLPIHHQQEQADTFARYMERHIDVIHTALRNGFLPAFRSHEPLLEYVEARNLGSLTPDPAWLDICRVPDDEQMRHRVAEWVSANGGSQAAGSSLLPVEEVRGQVRGILRQLGPDFGELLPAWCHAHQQPIPQIWTTEDPGNALATLAYEQGWTDFEPLALDDAVARLRVAGTWPADMPSTTDLAALGLTAGDLRWRQEAASRERERREEARFTVTLNGTPISSAPHRQRDFENSVLFSITEHDLDFLPDAVSLQPVSDTERRTSGTSGQRRNAARRPTENQLDAIGYAGELIAMRWIEHHFGVDAAACWKSRYSDRYLGRSGGDDSLGYDFAVHGPRPTFIEVKATVGEEMEIALGESEVRVAYDYRSERRAHYRILYISHVLDSANRKLALLPNPFSRRGQDLFRVVGQGMRFAFEVRRR